MDKALLNQKLELVLDRLMHLDAPDAAMDKGTSDADHKKGLIARDFGIAEWDWPQGVGLYGLLQLQAAKGTNEYDEFLLNWIKNNREFGLPSKNINTSAPFLTLFDLICRYDLPELEEMCKEHADWLIHDLPRTTDGGFEHMTSAIGNRNGVARNPEQLWADTLFMAVLFLGKMGARYNNDEWIQESVYQFLIHIEYLYEETNGLFHHGWTFEDHSNFGGIYWCRGNSWFTYGAVAFLEAVGDKMPECARRIIMNAWKHQVEMLARLQDPETGLWHTVLDDPTSYVESSGSGAIAAGILFGVRNGLLDESYKAVGAKAVEGLMNMVAEDGTVLSVSAGTHVGMTADHYRNIMIHPMAYGQSLTSLALTEGLYL